MSDLKNYVYIDDVFFPFLSVKVCVPMTQMFYAVHYPINNNNHQVEMYFVKFYC
jgi:hypothetical protein